ncbi:MAG: hypothetical protein EBU70_15385 [Actinobacteria bacterium]|nr:hypothetical protein [Actinomycetota bacterium]
MSPQGTLLLGETPIVLCTQGPSLGTGALRPCLLPGVDDIHAPGDAGLHDAGELIAVAGHASTLRRVRPAWHPRLLRT